TFHSPPSSAYSALPILFSASAACQRTCSLPALRTAASAVMRGGVLSIQNGLLSMRAVKASDGGLAGASEAVTRMRYSPSAKAVESHDRYFSVILSRSGFHSLSLTPRISTVNTMASPLGSTACHRAPMKPLANCMAGVLVVASSVSAAATGRLPIGGSDSDGCAGVSAGDEGGKR